MATITQWQLDRLFTTTGPFIHLSTSHLENDLLMENDEDRTVTLNMIALCSRKTGIDVLAYALMSNHIHLMLRADEVQGRTFFEHLHKRLMRYYSSIGRKGCVNGITCGITPITSIRQFRDELVYVIRNPFVVQDDVHLFSYRWCSGYLYFNTFLSSTAGKPADRISYRERRAITRTSDEALPPEFRIEGRLILPESFVNYTLVEQLFENARKFLNWSLRNVEAQVQVAQAYGERPHLSDDELFILSRDLCERMFGTRKPQELDESQKKEFAMTLRNQYHAGNKQLARLSTLPQDKVNDMYPLTAKR